MSGFMQMGGVFMWPVLVFGLATLAAALRYAAAPEHTRGRQTLALGVLTVLSGCAGTSLGFVMTLTAMGRVPAEDRFIAMIGLGESMCNVALALVLVTFAALVVAVGTWRLPTAQRLKQSTVAPSASARTGPYPA